MSGVLHHRFRHGEDVTVQTVYRLLYNSGFLTVAFLTLLLACVFILDRAW